MFQLNNAQILVMAVIFLSDYLPLVIETMTIRGRSKLSLETLRVTDYGKDRFSSKYRSCLPIGFVYKNYFQLYILF